MAIDAHTADVLDLYGETLGDVLIRRLIHRHPQVITVAILELLSQIGAAEPILVQPIEVSEPLAGKLIELAAGPGGKRLAGAVRHL